jgi:cysteinyl-tRNA synthetase
MDFTEDKIEEAKKALERISILMDKVGVRVSKGKDIKEVEEIKERFLAAMDDDFNTPQALACVFDLVNAANKNIEDADFSSAAAIALREMLDILGIKLTQVASIGAISDSEIQSKINERNQARKNKDFALSDKIRKELEEKGVILEDSKEGTSWRRKI